MIKDTLFISVGKSKELHYEVSRSRTVLCLRYDSFIDSVG